MATLQDQAVMDGAVTRLVNKEYSDVTAGKLMEMYPTNEWPYRYSRKVYGWR